MTKTASSLDIAKYFIEIANSVDENDLTNLKLQKLLYFSQGKFLAKTEQPLFSEDIEAWDLGPVVKNVYSTFKVCGSFPITNFDIKFESKKIAETTKDFINKIWNEYGKFSASYLVDKTHKKNSPWDKARKTASKIIDREEMREYFKVNATI